MLYCQAMNRIIKIFLLFLMINCGKQSVDPMINEQVSSYVIVKNLEWRDFDASEEFSDKIRRNASLVGRFSVVFKDPFSDLKKISCTGFLVGPDIMITNEHCFPEKIVQASEIMSVQLTFKSSQGLESYNCNEFIGRDQKYDMALFRCGGTPGYIHGYFDLNRIKKLDVKKNSEVYVIHYNCNFFDNKNCKVRKKLSPGKIIKAEGFDMLHTADTLSGSSGSPVFLTKTDQLIGIHYAGESFNENKGKGIHNYALKIEDISKVIEEKFFYLNLLMR
jgi:V8-like Glu-specific endopeptidase